jgi:predicted O-methyltransferase YrrM
MMVDGIQHQIPTWTEPETFDYWRLLAGQSQWMVESGTYIGASAYAMLEANPNLHLWTVDHFQAFAFNEEIARFILGKFIAEHRCETVKGNMDKAGEILVHMRGRIDAIVIDDGHLEEDLRRDIRNALPLLKPGGIMCGHDWDGDNDVARGVKSMLPVQELYFPVPRVWAWRKP